jgi:molybdate transport system substrate-binding protein
MRKELLILLVLLSVFFAVGCVDNKGGSPNATGTPVTTATSATVIPEVITVSGAASLTEAFTKIASQFEKENPGTNVTLNFGGSGNLRMQIEG